MNRIEFIVWLENKSGLSRRNDDSDNDWRELMNYAEYIWDELIVESDKVIFNWEEWEWGGINYIKYPHTTDSDGVGVGIGKRSLHLPRFLDLIVRKVKFN